MIRQLIRTEIKDALPLAWKMFCEYEAVNYSEDGKQAFRDSIYSEEYLESLTAYGAFEDEKMIGIIIIIIDESEPPTILSSKNTTD